MRTRSRSSSLEKKTLQGPTRSRKRPFSSPFNRFASPSPVAAKDSTCLIILSRVRVSKELTACFGVRHDATFLHVTLGGFEVGHVFCCQGSSSRGASRRARATGSEVSRRRYSTNRRAAWSSWSGRSSTRLCSRSLFVMETFYTDLAGRWPGFLAALRLRRFSDSESLDLLNHLCRGNYAETRDWKQLGWR